jgi:YD repeat-containing protein
LETTLTYSGNNVTTVTDPAGRVTRFTYSGDNLESITDPDGSKRTFQYEDPNLERLLTSQVHKRGNAANEPLADDFKETIRYNDYGRVIGGERLDEKKFSLTPAQMLAVFEASQTSDPAQAPTVKLLSKLQKVVPDSIVRQFAARRVGGGLLGQGGVHVVSG